MKRQTKHRNRSQQLKMRLHIIAAVVFILCAIAGTVITVRLYKQRKETEALIAAREYAKTEKFDRFRGSNVEYQGKNYRRNSYVKAILIMGVDRKGSMTESTTFTMGGQADGVFLVAQDTARNTLKILLIPRDTMTNITLTDIRGNVLGKDLQHLTLAYAYGDGRELSCERMTEAVSEFLGGMAIDHYLAADTDTITMLNDAVGGVTVTVPVDGLEKVDPAFVKGATITLKGAQAESFVRYRNIKEAHSAIYRMERHKRFITGFFQAIRQEATKNSTIVTDIFDEIQDYMVTDMGKEEYLKVAMDALSSGELKDEDIYTVPGESIMTEIYNEFYADKEELTPIILEMFYREV